VKKLSQQKNIIKCSDIEPHLFDFIQQELGQAQSTVISEHLKKCDKCRASLHELQDSLKALEDFGIEKTPKRLTDKRKKKIKFAYMHPLLNFCYLHHMAISLIIVLIALLTIMFMIRDASLLKEKEPVTEYPIHLNLVR
jgi:predicted anti-sigma-YlaC factor YlaD